MPSGQGSHTGSNTESSAETDDESTESGTDTGMPDLPSPLAELIPTQTTEDRENVVCERGVRLPVGGFSALSDAPYLMPCRDTQAVPTVPVIGRLAPDLSWASDLGPDEFGVDPPVEEMGNEEAELSFELAYVTGDADHVYAVGYVTDPLFGASAPDYTVFAVSLDSALTHEWTYRLDLDVPGGSAFAQARPTSASWDGGSLLVLGTRSQPDLSGTFAVEVDGSGQELDYIPATEWDIGAMPFGPASAGSSVSLAQLYGGSGVYWNNDEVGVSVVGTMQWAPPQVPGNVTWHDPGPGIPPNTVGYFVTAALDGGYWISGIASELEQCFAIQCEEGMGYFVHITSGEVVEEYAIPQFLTGHAVVETENDLWFAGWGTDRAFRVERWGKSRGRAAFERSTSDELPWSWVALAEPLGAGIIACGSHYGGPEGVGSGGVPFTTCYAFE